MTGFLDKLFGKLKPRTDTSGKNKKNTLIKEGYLYKPQSIDGKLIIGNNTPIILGELSIENHKYIVAKMKITFEQQLNKKRLPDSLAQIGIISLTLVGKTDDLIDEWMLNSRKVHSGDLRFFKNDIKEVGQSLSNIFFGNAYCVDYQRNIDIANNLNETNIMLYPETLKIANEEF